MIPKSSQRKDGAGLAAHLLNAEDNELVEVMELHGTIAGDLTGGLREMEASFLASTKGINPFYHVQISPDPRQAWSDELTYDYVSRIILAIGLKGQPFALVRHIKEMPDGFAREHFHFVASRLDINECKAIPISFDHIKLQYITREFARDHDLKLAPGYYNFADRARQTYRQNTLNEKNLTDHGYLARGEHQEVITPLWEGRVSPEGFIKALSNEGYMLAFGKRPVIVDTYGKEHSLARLIDIDEVKVRVIREFLGDHYNEDDLPSVDDAKALANQHRDRVRQYTRSEKFSDKLKALEFGQTVRREKIETEIAAKVARDILERSRADVFALEERRAHRRAFLEKRREIKLTREEGRPTGLAAFLGTVTGVMLIQRKIHKHQDKLLFASHQQAKQEITERQQANSEEMRLSHQMRALDAERQRRENGYREAQEVRSLKRHFDKESRLSERGNQSAPTPAPALELSPFGRPAMPAKAMTRYTGSSYKDRATPKEFQNDSPIRDSITIPEYPLAGATSDEFYIAAHAKSDQAEASSSGDESKGPSPKPGKPLPYQVELNDFTPDQFRSNRPITNQRPQSTLEIPTRNVPPLPSLEERTRKLALPKTGELTERFDAAAKGEMDGEKISSGTGHSPTPQPLDGHSKSKISDKEDDAGITDPWSPSNGPGHDREFE